MAISWRTIQSQPEFLNFTPEEQEAVKSWYQKKYIESDPEWNTFTPQEKNQVLATVFPKYKGAFDRTPGRVNQEVPISTPEYQVVPSPAGGYTSIPPASLQQNINLLRETTKNFPFSNFLLGDLPIGGESSERTLARQVANTSPTAIQIMPAQLAMEAINVPIKHGIEQPLSYLATEGKAEDYEGWLKDAGWGDTSSKLIAGVIRSVTSGLLYGVARQGMAANQEQITAEKAAKIKDVVDTIQSGNPDAYYDFMKKYPQAAQSMDAYVQKMYPQDYENWRNIWQQRYNTETGYQPPVDTMKGLPSSTPTPQIPFHGQGGGGPPPPSYPSNYLSSQTLPQYEFPLLQTPGQTPLLPEAGQGSRPIVTPKKVLSEKMKDFIKGEQGKKVGKGKITKEKLQEILSKQPQGEEIDWRKLKKKDQKSKKPSILKGEEGSFSPGKILDTAQNISSFAKQKIRPSFNPLSSALDNRIRIKNAQRFAANRLKKEMLQELPDKQQREDSYLNLAQGLIPSHRKEIEFMERLKAWGKRAAESGAIEKPLDDYVPYMSVFEKYDPGTKSWVEVEAREATKYLDTDKQEWIEKVDPRFSKWSGHFQHRTSKDWIDYVEKVQKIDSILSAKGYRMRPVTDIADVQYRYENVVAQKILNHEYLNYLEDYITDDGKPLLKLAGEAWGDNDYTELPNNLNIKVKWTKSGNQVVPLKYFAHKDLKDALVNYLSKDPGQDSAIVQGWIGLNNVVKRLKLFNPVFIMEKAIDRIIATDPRALKNIPKVMGMRTGKNDKLVEQFIKDGGSLWEEWERSKDIPINEIKKEVSKLYSVSPLNLSDKIVKEVLQSLREYLYLHYRETYIKAGHSPDRSGRMAAKMANDNTYAVLRHEKSPAFRTLGKMFMFSPNKAVNELNIYRRLIGGGEEIFTSQEKTSMSKEEWKRLIQYGLTIGTVSVLLNKKNTGRYFNTEQGVRGKTAITKPDEKGNVVYINTLDQYTDMFNILSGQGGKLLGQIAPTPLEIGEQIFNKKLWKDEKITEEKPFTKENLKDRALHVARSFTPGEDTISGIENIPYLAKVVKEKGMAGLLKDKKTKIGLFLAGKWATSRTEGVDAVLDILKTQDKEKKETREEIKETFEIYGSNQAYKELRKTGLSRKEARRTLILMKNKNPVSGLFHELTPENKIKAFQALKDNKNIPERVKSDLYDQLKRSR